LRTSLGKDGHLSRAQIVRLGGLIAVVCGRTPYQHILDDLLSNKFLTPSQSCFELTSLGTEELNRLTGMAGLMHTNFSDK
tara:strand:+ start:631 stop:870 length:240 start_codon:yes stop_codon:yes gene_type:complete